MTLPLLALAASLAAAAPGSPLTLDDALAEAARANHDLRLARTDRERAATDVVTAYSGVLPRLDLSAAWGRQFTGARRSVEFVTVADPATGLPTVERRDVDVPARDDADYSLGLRLDQPVFDLPSWRRIDAARATERATERSVDELSLATAFDVTRRFYEVVKADESLRVLEETVRRSQDLLGRAEALFTAGRAPKADVFSARVNLENDRASAEAQRARAAQARADLAQAIGRGESEGLTVVPPSTVTGPVVVEAEPAPLDALAAQARARRPLLAARRESSRAASSSVDAARGAFWPVLSAQGAYTRAGTELAGREGVYGNPTRQYVATAQLVLAWNLFAGRETTAAEQRAAIAARRTGIELEQAETQVDAELARARASAVALGRTTVISQAALAAAEEGARAARDRFEAGAATQLEVRDAELKLTQARLSLLNARVDQAVARADLARATGGPLP